ncbi:hypothetical protein LguiA_034734 [Lonicera macranthoides]
MATGAGPRATRPVISALNSVKSLKTQLYHFKLIITVAYALALVLDFGSKSRIVTSSLLFFRFWLGFGIGGDYPLSAVIMSEYSNLKTQGGAFRKGTEILVLGALALNVFGRYNSKDFGLLVARNSGTHHHM